MIQANITGAFCEKSPQPDKTWHGPDICCRIRAFRLRVLFYVSHLASLPPPCGRGWV